jgi:lipopolysaccharide biosynthesis glycosyltransferase
MVTHASSLAMDDVSDKQEMTFVMLTDDGYLVPTMVTLYSFLNCNKSPKHIIVLLKSKNPVFAIDLLSRLVVTTDCAKTTTLTFVNVNGDIQKDIEGVSLTRHQGADAQKIKIILPTILGTEKLPITITDYIWLDTDILVMKDIAKLYHDCCASGAPIGAANLFFFKSERSDPKDIEELKKCFSGGVGSFSPNGAIPTSDHYRSSNPLPMWKTSGGVMYFNLSKLQKYKKAMQAILPTRSIPKLSSIIPTDSPLQSTGFIDPKSEQKSLEVSSPFCSELQNDLPKQNIDLEKHELQMPQCFGSIKSDIIDDECFWDELWAKLNNIRYKKTIENHPAFKDFNLAVLGELIESIQRWALYSYSYEADKASFKSDNSTIDKDAKLLADICGQQQHVDKQKLSQFYEIMKKTFLKSDLCNKIFVFSPVYNCKPSNHTLANDLNKSSIISNMQFLITEHSLPKDLNAGITFASNYIRMGIRESLQALSEIAVGEVAIWHWDAITKPWNKTILKKL